MAFSVAGPSSRNKKHPLCYAGSNTLCLQVAVTTECGLCPIDFMPAGPYTTVHKQVKRQPALTPLLYNLF